MFTLTIDTSGFSRMPVRDLHNCIEQVLAYLDSGELTEDRGENLLIFDAFKDRVGEVDWR